MKLGSKGFYLFGVTTKTMKRCKCKRVANSITQYHKSHDGGVGPGWVGRTQSLVGESGCCDASDVIDAEKPNSAHEGLRWLFGQCFDKGWAFMLRQKGGTT